MSGDVCGFLIESHGDSIVCAATSMLAINTVNSLELLTDCKLAYCYSPDGGYIECLTDGLHGGAALLLKAMELGLLSLEAQYGVKLTIKEIAPGIRLGEKRNMIIFER